MLQMNQREMRAVGNNPIRNINSDRESLHAGKRFVNTSSEET